MEHLSRDVAIVGSGAAGLRAAIEDLPEQDEERWRGHLRVSLSPEGKEIWSFDPITCSVRQ